MIRAILEWQYRGAGHFISLPDCAHSFRAMEPSSLSSVRIAPRSHHAQQQRQQGNHRTNGGSINSVAAGANSKKGSFGGTGQTSSSQGVAIQFGTVGVSDSTPSYSTNDPPNDFPQRSNASKASVPALQTVTASLDGEQLGKGSKLGSKASPLPVEGTSAIVQNTNSQVTPKPLSQHRPWGSGRHPFVPEEASKESVPATPSPSIDDFHFPALGATLSAGNRDQGSGRGRAEQVHHAHLPRGPQQLKQAGEVDSPISVQTGAEKEWPPGNFNQNRESVFQDRHKGGDRKGAELRNGQEFGNGRDGRQNRPGRDPAWEKAGFIDTLGRALTKILRHKAVELRLEMSSDGYVDVQDILKLSMKTGSNRPLTSHSIADVKQAVQQDNKQRLGIKEENGRLFIRANQGHSMQSVNSEHLLKPIVSADEVPVCVHGTYRRYLDLIFKEGLKRMQRNQIHFASGVAGSQDVISGMRSTCEVLIYLNVDMALADGMKLYISDNKVILTDGFEGVVPPKYFKKVLGLPDMKPIAAPRGPA